MKDPPRTRRQKIKVSSQAVLEVIEPSHLLLRSRTRRVELPPVHLISVYRFRNAECTRRMVKEVSATGGRVALWALDAVHPQLAPFTAGVGPGSRFDLLNQLLPHVDPRGDDWVAVADDDVAFSRGTISDAVRASRAAGLDLSQPSHERRSHMSWNVVRHRVGVLVRRNRYIEQGPVFFVGPRARDAVFPFPTGLGMGWGVEAIWGAHRMFDSGIVDAVLIRHLAPVGGSYDQAVEWRRAETLLAEQGFASWHDLQADRGRWFVWESTPRWLVGAQ